MVLKSKLKATCTKQADTFVPLLSVSVSFIFLTFMLDFFQVFNLDMVYQHELLVLFGSVSYDFKYFSTTVSSTLRKKS